MTTAATTDDGARCDTCDALLHRQRFGGWWVGDDDTAECPANPRGHTVGGLFR